jgi:hypothetical protein
MRGQSNANIRALMKDFPHLALKIVPDPTVSENEIRICPD